MDERVIIDGLISYLCFLPALTVHECAHAWVAWKCGDDTARLQGRVTLNPVAHIDLLGTILMPLLAVFLFAAKSSLGAFVIGWGKPVPVNTHNLRHPQRDDILVSLAGPASNILLAIFLMALAKISMLTPWAILPQVVQKIAVINLMLCFFNLIPVPPLDGSHVIKHLFGMSDEFYARLCQYSFIFVILAINLPPVRAYLGFATYGSYGLLCYLLGLPF